VIKCVIWDLDNTLLDGVYLESPDQPPPADPVLAGVLAELAGRGILHAIASRNPPEAAVYADQATGHAFAAARCGWDAKSAAITAIVTELGLSTDAVAFVDDDALERAEVSFALPDVLVLAPEDMAEAAAWPQFSPPVLTAEGRRRGALYQQSRSRQEEAKAFGGSREAFLLHLQTHVAITSATTADLPRLYELSVRTHQFNSAGHAISEAEFAGFLSSARHRVAAVRLSDKFGDDGLVGGCLIETVPGGGWRVPLVMMSCRAMGRGVIDAVLGWLCRAAQAAAADQVVVPCVVDPRNVPLRIALAGAGFRAERDATSDGRRTAWYVRRLADPLPVIPAWTTVADGT
jgi:methoxymalonate biosynthesis protein